MPTIPDPDQDKRNRQSRENVTQAEEVQPTRSFQRDFELECQHLAEQIANIPSVVRQHLANIEDNRKNYRHNADDYGDLASQVRRLDHKVQRKDHRVQELERELQASQAEIQSLRAKEQSLRQHVLQNGSYYEVSRGQVVDGFVKIRQHAQRLASSKLFKTDGHGESLNHVPLIMNAVTDDLWQRSNRSDRRFLLRAIIFQRLIDEVFNCEFFGISESGADQGQDQSAARDLDAGLVPYDVVSNWRLSTIRSIETAGLADKPFGVALAERMYKDFSGLIRQEATPQETTKLRNDFETLCNQAYDLQLLMRKSQEDYRFHYIVPGVSLEGLGDIADSYGELEGTTDGGTKVAFTMFGALILNTRSCDEKPRVLERAQVIVTSE
ncbi:hypothetical protein EDB80DRAFT_865447 [Ilyonectria destructans]|nr:hypothetical protein EDB80DRAFT_865447 [Ilyonectria destructans]